LLLLDEPANGLDPAGIVEIRELLLELTRQQGVTVFMSSHILAEVSRLANRIGIIHEGRLLQEMDTSELEHDRRSRLLVNVHDLEAARSVLVAAGHTLKYLDGAIVLTDPAALDRPDDIASLLVLSRNPPTRLNLEQEDLEQYFLRLVGLEKGDGMGEKVSVDGGIQ
jgi:ABC-2 type transport system ATP-binding protein